ncbi:hypothetical protein XENTR_v10014498 [Xenopus tropicalis]|nr:hypothetical protein XENTR_v10014498 [Xenopus tropicalis]
MRWKCCSATSTSRNVANKLIRIHVYSWHKLLCPHSNLKYRCIQFSMLSLAQPHFIQQTYNQKYSVTKKRVIEYKKPVP